MITNEEVSKGYTPIDSLERTETRIVDKPSSRT